MANVKLSQLPAASALTGDEIVPVVQGGQTRRSTAAELADLRKGGDRPEAQYAVDKL